MLYSIHLLIIFIAIAQRKHESLEVDEENTIIAENEVLWRANFEKLIFCLKMKVCLYAHWLLYIAYISFFSVNSYLHILHRFLMGPCEDEFCLANLFGVI
jgi:hypothetical protein